MINVTEFISVNQPNILGNSKEITNDLQHCKQMAKDNTTLGSNISFWLMSPKAQTQYEDIYRKCMINRGHSVLN